MSDKITVKHPDGHERHIKVPDVGEVSDGHHTFNELYDHRHALFMALMAAHPEMSWRSKQHEDGSMWEGWFIAGMELPNGMITYHMPEANWHLLDGIVQTLDKAPKWDGHTAEQVVERLRFHIAEVGNVR